MSKMMKIKRARWEKRWDDPNDAKACPFCGRYMTEAVQHHIIPRSVTNRKHPAQWLNDERNLLDVCFGCHDEGVVVEGREGRLNLHTKLGKKLCCEKQKELHSDWDMGVRPWGAVLV